ncbi:MAG TPA: LPXTG cell wall anchor domain-containing protein [Candidatus Dormibacteraeota bacterium]|nr:LPXTG cell wall anchor domain-containing protein [Candidatus Dormibacteraeota bacterium]
MSPLPRHRRPVLAVSAAMSLAAAAAALTPSLGAPIRGGAASAITFETPSIVDPLQTGGEPDVAVDPQGRVFASAPTGTGTQRSVWYGSVDGGHTFHAISANKPADTLTTFTQPPGGGDTDIQFDRSGKQYFSDLYALTCFRTATTTDGGATVQSDPQGGCAKTNGSGGDRQWEAVYDPPPGTPKDSAYTGPTPLVYMEYNAYPVGGEWEKSTDGLTYTNAVNGNGGLTLNYSPYGHDGYPSIDQQTGDVFEANYISGSTSTTSDIVLNIGVPDAAGNLDFLDAPANDESKLITVAKDVPDDRGDVANFVVSSMDQGRNLWVAWVARSSDPTKSQTYVAVASAASGWRQWSAPVQVSRPSGGSYTSIFPWIKAGGAGRADVVWYGADRYTDPSVNNGQSWDVFMSQVVWPVDGSGGAGVDTAPAVTQVKVTPHPMKYGDVCLQGTGCIEVEGNRNLADFFNVSIDRSGAAEVVYDDTSNGLAETGFTTGQQIIDHAGAPVITVARQNGGPGLYGSDVSGPSNAPANGLTDSAGDALYPVVGGANVPGMDLLGTRLSLSGSTLKIVDTVVDLSNPLGTGQAINGPFLQYVTRWQMGNTIYFAAFETTATGQQQFYAGQAQSIDLCSVSACDPHIVYYPEVGTATHSESGTVTCPQTPSVATPCTVEIDVNTADVGSPAAAVTGAAVSSSAATPPLEEIGTYSMASLVPQATLNNAGGQIDNVPLILDGLCCFNATGATLASSTTTTTTTSSSSSGGGASRSATLPNTSTASPAAGAAAAAALASLGVLAALRRRRRTGS